jgi:hypothetical protein
MWSMSYCGWERSWSCSYKIGYRKEANSVECC